MVYICLNFHYLVSVNWLWLIVKYICSEYFLPQNYLWKPSFTKRQTHHHSICWCSSFILMRSLIIPCNLLFMHMVSTTGCPLWKSSVGCFFLEGHKFLTYTLWAGHGTPRRAKPKPLTVHILSDKYETGIPTGSYQWLRNTDQLLLQQTYSVDCLFSQRHQSFQPGCVSPNDLFYSVVFTSHSRSAVIKLCDATSVILRKFTAVCSVSFNNHGWCLNF